MTTSTGTGAPSPRDGIEAANRMTDTLGEFAAELKKLSARDKRSRAYLRILAVSFAIDIILTVAFGFLALQTDSNSRTIHQSQLTACASANQQRDNERAIWDYVLGELTVPAPGESAQQVANTKTAIAVIEKKVATTFADRDCKTFYKLP